MDFDLVSALLAAGRYPEAEISLRQWIASDSGSAAAREFLADLLCSMGRDEESLSILQSAPPITPRGRSTLARLYERAEKWVEAAAEHLRAAELPAAGDAARHSYVDAAKCFIRGGQQREGLQILANAGALTANSVAYLKTRDPTLVDALTARELEAVFWILTGEKDAASLIAVGTAAWWNRDVTDRESLMNYLPAALHSVGQHAEAGLLFLNGLERGYPVSDFRPRWDNFTLDQFDSGLAERARVDQRTRYLQDLESTVAIAWRPLILQSGAMLLRGAVLAKSASEIEFRIRRTGEDSTEHRHPALSMKSIGPYAIVSAEAACLSEGEYDVEMLAHDTTISAPIRFDHRLSGLPGAAETSGATPVGLDGAVFTGRAASTARGARVCFEFGTDPNNLNFRTEWQGIPPGLNALVAEGGADQNGWWLPRSTHAEWIEHQGLPVLRLEGPFAKDRNQLNGIGSHEMPLNIGWGEPDEDEPSLRLEGGDFDLRDAEITITLRGDVQPNDYWLTFWIDRHSRDDSGDFWSQWALTGSPIPDAAFQSLQWKNVSLTLPNDPRYWTYTGANPREQGRRSMRYRRLPLPETLRHNNAPFVLIFAFGEERTPPSGWLEIKEIRARYRSRSAITSAAGAALAEWPAYSISDPLSLSEGARGIDSDLWVSQPTPAYPLTFTWNLAKPLPVSAIGIAQHPYCPAREVEVVGHADQNEIVIWLGTLPEPSTSAGMRPYLYAPIEFARRSTFSAISLRIKSGYGPERVGLDRFEVFSDETVFAGDGRSLRVSAEVERLPPTGPIFYRLILNENSAEICGEIEKFKRPAKAEPLLHSAELIVRSDSSRSIKVRGNAMGLETSIWVAIETPEGGSVEGPRISFGCQPTDRDLYYPLTSDFPTSARLWVYALNIAGQSRCRAGAQGTSAAEGQTFYRT